MVLDVTVVYYELVSRYWGDVTYYSWCMCTTLPSMNRGEVSFVYKY